MFICFKVNRLQGIVGGAVSSIELVLMKDSMNVGVSILHDIIYSTTMPMYA